MEIKFKNKKIGIFKLKINRDFTIEQVKKKILEEKNISNCRLIWEEKFLEDNIQINNLYIKPHQFIICDDFKLNWNIF